MSVSNLQKRSISAALLFPLVSYVINYGGWLYGLWAIIAGLLVLYEWHTIVAQNAERVFTSQVRIQRIEWHLLGIVYSCFFTWAMLVLRDKPNIGASLVFWLVLVVCSTDIGGYFVGRKVGGPKIAPTISPSKTWSGLVGGMALSLLSSAIFQSLYSFGNAFPALVLAPIVSVVSQAGDFLESAFKRKFGVKDSGWLIPGHGGVMDRVDGMVTAAGFMLLYDYFFHIGT